VAERQVEAGLALQAVRRLRARVQEQLGAPNLAVEQRQVQRRGAVLVARVKVRLVALALRLVTLLRGVTSAAALWRP
jgi:hypothetical protein